MEDKKQGFPKRGTAGYRLLEMAAICGEIPASLPYRLNSSTSYTETLLWSLKKDKLLRLYSRDKLKGYRLGIKAKKYLLEDQPERFTFYLTGNTDTNLLKSEINRRLRLHRIAETYAAMRNADVAVFRDEKPMAFARQNTVNTAQGRSFFYNSREIKELGIQTVKIRGSRMTGILLAPSGIFITYNGGPHTARWDYRTEQRVQALLKILCQQRPDAFSGRSGIAGILFGDGMDTFTQILSSADSGSRCFFLLDGNYEHFYYFTNDRHGEVLLRLLCDTGRTKELNRILMEGLYARETEFTMENDAMDGDGNPVLFGYFLDIPRINRFCRALQLHDRKGTLVCFDFQKDTLNSICGERVELSAISFEKFERRFFP